MNYAQVNSTNNYWDSTIISKGLLRVGANEALPSGATTYVVADSASEWACLDLRGHVQTLANLKDYEKDASAMKGEFVIRLDLADGATLSVPAGVTVKVAYAQVGNSGSDGKRLERGTYTKANLPNLISGDGKFVVKYDAGGLVIMVK